MTDELTARQIVEEHTVRGRRCSCGHHHHDAFPEVCEPAYEQLSAHEQLALGELRCGVVRDPEALDGIEASVSTPAPYASSDPISNPLDKW